MRSFPRVTQLGGGRAELCRSRVGFHAPHCGADPTHQCRLATQQHLRSQAFTCVCPMVERDPDVTVSALTLQSSSRIDFSSDSHRQQHAPNTCAFHWCSTFLPNSRAFKRKPSVASVTPQEAPLVCCVLKTSLPPREICSFM